MAYKTFALNLKLIGILTTLILILYIFSCSDPTAKQIIKSDDTYFFTEVITSLYGHKIYLEFINSNPLCDLLALIYNDSGYRIKPYSC
jgi:hypothetical protein